MERTASQRKPVRGHISDALLGGLIMSVCAVLIWFLMSTSAKTTGLLLFAVTLTLTVINALCLILVRYRQKRFKVFIQSLLILFNAVAFLSVTVFSLASSQLFYPHFDEESYAALQAKETAEELTVTADGEAISGWMAHNVPGKAPLVLYFAGNGENASRRMLGVLENDLTDMFKGYNFSVFDYPGYGKSSGAPSEASLKKMGLAAFDALCARDDVDAGKIVVFGYSLGTGVANYVAENRNVAGLILMAPYADGYDLYNGMVDIFHGPLRLLVGFRMESVRFAKGISVQPLILASKSDEMVNYVSSVRLAEAYPAGCLFEAFDGLQHNGFWRVPAVRGNISDYLAEVRQNG